MKPKDYSMPTPGKDLSEMTAAELEAYKKQVEEWDPSKAAYATKQLAQDAPWFAKLNPAAWIGAGLTDLFGGDTLYQSYLKEQESRLNEIAAYEDALTQREIQDEDIKRYKEEAAKFQGEVRAWMMATGADIRAAGSPAAIIAYNRKVEQEDIEQIKKNYDRAITPILREASAYNRGARALATMRPWEYTTSLLSGMADVYSFLRR